MQRRDGSLDQLPTLILLFFALFPIRFKFGDGRAFVLVNCLGIGLQDVRAGVTHDLSGEDWRDRSKQLKSGTNGSTGPRCNCLRNIVESKIFRMNQES
jgi:hypothetical protein